MEKVRSRCWVSVLYPEDETHVECMARLASGGYSFAAILHDHDTWEKDESKEHVAGEPKKEHWHVVLRLSNARWRDGIAEELGIKPNYLEPCRNRDSALLYLVHDGYPNKYQYELAEVFGTLKENLAKLLTDEDEGSRVMTIIAMIDELERPASYRTALIKACQNGLYGDFRRLGVGIKWLLDEHNGSPDYYAPCAGAYTDAKTQARFEGFVLGHQAGINDIHNSKR